MHDLNDLPTMVGYCVLGTLALQAAGLILLSPFGLWALYRSARKRKANAS